MKQVTYNIGGIYLKDFIKDYIIFDNNIGISVDSYNYFTDGYKKFEINVLEYDEFDLRISTEVGFEIEDKVLEYGLDYEITHSYFEDLSYFENTKPFLNASMENQLCYDFPRPATDLSKIVNLNFEAETNLKALENIWVKKFKLLKLAIDKGDKKWEKIIDAKIKLEKLEQSRTMTIVDFDEKIQKSLAKFPEIRLTWEEIEIFLNQNKELF